MKFFEIKKDGRTYRFTAHGQTPDLYEELYGEDADILSDLKVYITGQSKMLAGMSKENLAKVQKLAEADINALNEAELLKILEESGKVNLNVTGGKKMRQIMTCMLMQTEYDDDRRPTVPELLKSVDINVFTDNTAIMGCIELITGKETKKKQLPHPALKR